MTVARGGEASDRIHRMMTDLYWFLHGAEFDGEDPSSRESMNRIVVDCATRWGRACSGPDRMKILKALTHLELGPPSAGANGAHGSVMSR